MLPHAVGHTILAPKPSPFTVRALINAATEYIATAQQFFVSNARQSDNDHFIYFITFCTNSQSYFAFNNSREFNTYFTPCKGDDWIFEVNHTEDKLEDTQRLEELRGMFCVFVCALAVLRAALASGCVVASQSRNN